MSVFIFANDASSTLAAPISSSAVSLTLASGTGAEFANPSTNQQFSLTMNDAATGLLTEIIYVPTRVGDTLSGLLRGQEGTTAQSWLAGDLAANLLTAGQMAAMLQVSTLYPSRTVTTSGAFTMSTADANGYVNLNRTAGVGVSSTTLPANAEQGQTYSVADLARNFNAYPVTVNAPAGMTIQTEDSVLLNVNGQVAIFEYAGNNIWSFKP
jgi:hypothetical protein